MTSFLSLVEGLQPEDVEWLIQSGQEVQLISGTLLLEEGKPTPAVYVVLLGLLEVRLEAMPGRSAATIGPGALVGDIAFLTGMAVTVDVRVVENSLLLEIPIATLEAHVHRDGGFGRRFYRALAALNARRLTDTTRRLNAEVLRGQQRSYEKEEPMGRLLARIGSFKEAVGALEKTLLKQAGDNLADMEAVASEQLMALSVDLIKILNPVSGLKESVRAELSHRTHIELLPWILLTDVTARMYTKPRGYAGDFLTIQKMYEDQAGGTGHIGPTIDRAFLNQPPVQAVRNRRKLMVQQIEQVFTPDRAVHVSSFACGPAREVFDAFEALGQPANLHVSLVDIDDQAIEFLEESMKDHPRRSQVTLLQSNLVYLALGREQLELPPQDLIYSVGLIDYFDDPFVVKLLNSIYGLLRPGGRVVLGNFHPRNPSKMLMEAVLQWKLIHRDEADMNRLFRASLFGQDCSEIFFEDAQVNLFAVGVK